ncbi:GNAT family acetyltransferase PA5433 [hydrothermal vent metagenome]|uniref:GNAT family acetyltransferase PA5433 n=1 Tax=hydrothermal vent metagenome TaxID=652676 RepID=A0A3B0TK09_9ZZZZ
MDNDTSRQDQDIEFTPRSAPEFRIHHGTYGRLEPLSAARHAPELHVAAMGDGGGQSWTYLPYGPFGTQDRFCARIADCEALKDPLFFALRNLDTGAAAGMASFMRINMAMGVIEIGHIWMAPSLQRTRAATDAIFLMMDHAMTDLGYRRLEWKCNAANAASRSAATRFGFTYEGTFRQHMIVKGRNRDTAWYSILDSEWPDIRRKFTTWLAPENFTADGRQIRRLGDCG